MGKEQRAVCSVGLVVEVEAAVLSKLGLSPSRVEEVYVAANLEGVFRRPEREQRIAWL